MKTEDFPRSTNDRSKLAKALKAIEELPLNKSKWTCYQWKLIKVAIGRRVVGEEAEEERSLQLGIFHFFSFHFFSFLLLLWRCCAIFSTVFSVFFCLLLLSIYVVVVVVLSLLSHCCCCVYTACCLAALICLPHCCLPIEVSPFVCQVKMPQGGSEQRHLHILLQCADLHNKFTCSEPL